MTFIKCRQNGPAVVLARGTAPRTLLSGAGTPLDPPTVVWDADYRPFGEAVITGVLAFNLRLPGQYYDSETGLHYNMARDYDPGLGTQYLILETVAA